MTGPDPITRLNAALEGRYRVERQLGEGGMATVYLADDLRHERKVALKVLKPELAAVVGADRFLAEIKTTANLQHPHILPLFDSGEADSFLFYVMPYVEGESLRERLDREHQLPVDEAVRIATSVAQALDYAHRHGVIHRDIKPANILLHDGQPLVSDFGIALAVSAGGGGRLTETGLSLGTPHYMSPEQATGDLSVGAASDIYALGCVLYEMLVAEPPYTGGTPQAILGKIVTGDADPVTRHRKAVPPNVDAAIRKALEKVPADRFSTAQDFSRALGDSGFRHGAPDAAVVPEVSSRWKALTATFAGLSLILAGALTWALSRPTSAPLETARLSIVVPGDRQMRAGGSPGRTVAISPDGRTVAYTGQAPSDRPGPRRLYVRSVGDPAVRELPGTEGAYQPFFSPDGAWVAFFVAPDELKKVRLDGGDALSLADGLGAVAWAFGTWTDAGEIVVGSLGGGLSVVPEDGGPAQPVTTLDTSRGEISHIFPDFVSGTRSVLFSAATPDGDRRIEAVDLDSHQRTVVVEGADHPLYLASGHLLYERDGTLVVAPFDRASMEPSGPAVPLGDDVLMVGGTPEWAVSRSGTFVYRPGTALSAPTLGIVDRSGTFESLGVETAANPHAAVSADGRYIAFDAPGPDQAIGLYDVRNRSSPRSLEGLRWPSWLPDGRTLSATRDLVELVLRDPDGTTRTLADVSGVGNLVRGVSWAPDGDLVVYTVQKGADEDIWTLTPGDEPRLLVGGPADGYGPSFSPSGRWIAYVSSESGGGEIYVRRYPSGEVHQVTTDGGGGVRWSPAGDELFITGLYEGARFMLSVPVREVGETLEIGEPVPLFAGDPPGPNGTTILYVGSTNSGASFDVFPDGQRFAMARQILEPSREIIIVQNFFEDVRRRLVR